MKRTTFITRTALMVALAIVAQLLRLIIPSAPTLLVGSLVNTMIVVSAGIVGGWGALAVSVVTPVVAFLQGGPIGSNPIFIPIIALGNLALGLLFVLFYRKQKLLGGIVGGAAGSLLKFAVLYVLMVLYAIPAFAPAKVVAPLSAAFGVSQLITAAIGSALGIIVLLLLKRAGIARDKTSKS